MDKFLLLFWQSLKWVVIHGYPQIIHTGKVHTLKLSTVYPQFIHKSVRRTRALRACVLSLPNARISLRLLGWHSHDKGCHALGQRLAWQQPPGGLNTAR